LFDDLDCGSWRAFKTPAFDLQELLELERVQNTRLWSSRSIACVQILWKCPLWNIITLTEEIQQQKIPRWVLSKT